MVLPRPGTLLFWESARLPFNAVLMMFSAVALEPIFLRLPPDIAWSHVLTLQLGLTFIVANVLYTSIYPLDRLLQRSAFQAKGSAGRVAIWSGLALVSVACVVRVAFGVVSMIFF